MRRPINSIPVLKGFIVGEQIAVWCPYCRNFHWHGLADGVRAMNHHRVAHCCDQIDSRRGKSPFKEHGYYIEPFTETELKELGKWKLAVSFAKYVPERYSQKNIQEV